MGADLVLMPDQGKVPWWPCAVTALLVGLVTLLAASKTPAFLSWDFHLFYAAGQLPSSELYDEREQMAAQYSIWQANLKTFREFNFSAFLKPAYYRLLLAPLARLPFWKAYAVWALVQLAAFASGLYLLARRYGYHAVWYIPLPLCPYLVITIGWGQDTGLVFLLMAAVLEFLLREKDEWAGAVLALGLIKWNTLLFLPLLLLVLKKWRALAAFSAIAAAEVCVSVWITGWRGAADYASMLSGPYADYLAVGMPSLRGLLLIAGIPNQIAAAALVIALTLAVQFLRTQDLQTQFALGVGISVVLAYHTMIYDLLLLLIPVIVLQNRLVEFWKRATIVLFLSPVPNLADRAAGGALWGKVPMIISILLFASAVFTSASRQTCALSRSAADCR